MGKEHLRPVRTSEEARALGSRPVSKKGRLNIGIGRRLQELKKKGLTDEKAAELFAVMMNPEMSSLDHRMIIEKLKIIVMKSEDPKEIDILSRNMALWHKQRHGEKMSIESKNININIDASKEEYLRRRKEWEEEQ